MSSAQAKPFVALARIFTRSEGKLNEVGLLESAVSIRLLKMSQALEFFKNVAEFENKQASCGSYLCLVPLEGDKTISTIFETYKFPPAHHLPTCIDRFQIRHS